MSARLDHYQLERIYRILTGHDALLVLSEITVSPFKETQRSLFQHGSERRRTAVVD